MYCCLPGCKSIFKPKSAGGVSFHRIPPVHSPLRQKWLDFIRSQNGGKDLNSYRTACLCSNHFTADCLLISSQCTRLTKYAVPTIIRPGVVPCTSCTQNDATTLSKIAPKMATSTALKTAPQLIISPLTIPTSVSGGNGDVHSELRFLSVHVSSNGEIDCVDAPKRPSPLMMNDDEPKSDCEPLCNVSLSDDELQKNGDAKKPKKYDGLFLKSLLNQPQKVVCPIKSIELDDEKRHKTAAELKQEIHELENTLARVEKLAKMRERKLKYWSTRNSRLEKTIHSLKAKLKKNMQKEDTEN